MDIIERTCNPTKFDIYPRLTICKVGAGPDEFGGQPADQYYIQLGTDESPLWAPMSSLFDNLDQHDNLYSNKIIVDELIALVFDKSRPYTHLANLLCNLKRNK